jgi:2-hydroxychromene-2-carboxylate isomerase
MPSSTIGPIEFWFDFSSPYAYFASEGIDQLARETGRAILWRPFLLGAVMTSSGMKPLVDMPLRGDYARHDWDRIARMLGVPFTLPASHPYAATKASRAFYWLERHEPAHAADFAHAIFRAHFVEGRDPSESSVIARCADNLALDGKALIEAIQSNDAKAMLRTHMEEAVEKKVFGAPHFIVDGEPFWGWDRMAMMRQWIERGGW